MKYFMLAVLLSASISVMGDVDCDTLQYDWYNNPMFNHYMDSTNIRIESDNKFNGDTWYNYATWFAQYDWEGKTKLKLHRDIDDPGNTVINITVSDLGTTGWFGMAWTEKQSSIVLTKNPTDPESVCNIDLNTFYMDGLLAKSKYSQFLAIVKHEIGHCLGLAHHGLTNEIMNYKACYYNKGPSCVVSQDACYTIDNVLY